MCKPFKGPWTFKAGIGREQIKPHWSEGTDTPDSQTSSKARLPAGQLVKSELTADLGKISLQQRKTLMFLAFSYRRARLGVCLLLQDLL